MTPSIPNLRISEDATGDLLLGWGLHGDHARLAHGLRIRRSRDACDANDSQPLFVRFLCHYIVDLIPDVGLAELCESLGDLYEFHNLPARQALLPTVTAAPGRLGFRLDRPDFHVEEE